MQHVISVGNFEKNLEYFKHEPLTWIKTHPERSARQCWSRLIRIKYGYHFWRPGKGASTKLIKNAGQECNIINQPNRILNGEDGNNFCNNRNYIILSIVSRSFARTQEPPVIGWLWCMSFKLLDLTVRSRKIQWDSRIKLILLSRMFVGFSTESRFIFAHSRHFQEYVPKTVLFEIEAQLIVSFWVYSSGMLKYEWQQPQEGQNIIYHSSQIDGHCQDRSVIQKILRCKAKQLSRRNK